MAPLALAACAHYPALVPGTGAALSNEGGATATDAGVTLVVQGDAWKADPRDLSEIMTPILISVNNRSGRPLQLRYSDFEIVGESGFRYAALPPFEPTDQAYGEAESGGGPASLAVSRTPPLPPRRFGHRHFFVAPYLSPYYNDFDVWPYPFAFDPFYWGQYYAVWVQPLPTRDMLSDALPEGVLQQEGELSGFVYFQNVTPREARVTFVAKLVDAHTNETFGEIRIPFDSTRK